MSQRKNKRALRSTNQPRLRLEPLEDRSLLAVAAPLGLGQPATTTAPAIAPPPKPISTFYREVWTTRQGLPHNQVNDMAQTPDGYL